jgi:hypothetical protein
LNTFLKAYDHTEIFYFVLLALSFIDTENENARLIARQRWKYGASSQVDSVVVCGAPIYWISGCEHL